VRRHAGDVRDLYLPPRPHDICMHVEQRSPAMAWPGRRSPAAMTMV
jgi:hypothetical protein